MNEELCRKIEDAFAGVKLGNGIGLNEGQGLDYYADKLTLAKYRAKDEKDDWHRLSGEELNRCQSSLSFFDALGMRFHIPAYMIADINGVFRHELVFHLTNLNDNNISRFALLSLKHRDAVRSFLLNRAESNYSRPIIRALKEYWIAA